MIGIVKDIVGQLDIMAYLNIISYSVLSGSGTSVSPSLHDLDTMEELCKDMPPNQRPYNIMFMNSLYNKNMPLYAKEIVNPYNFEEYQWAEKKRKKMIDIKVLACSILSCCNIIEKLITNRIQLENNQFISFILFNTALYQARFIKQHLKIGDLYYSGEDVAKADSQEPHIQIAPDNPDSVSQLSVLQAFTALKRLGTYNLPYMQLNDDEFEEDLDLLSPLYASVLEHVADIKSKELANIGLCIAGVYIYNDTPCKAAYKTLDSIGTELIKRINENGEIMRTGSEVEESSASTLFNCLNLLSQLYYMFGNKACLHACFKIYRRLSTKWDQEHCIFKLKDSNKQSYSIKDISAIISALMSFYCIAADTKLTEQVIEQIKGVYETAFIKSQIFSGQKHPILQQNIMELNQSINTSKDAAPVFNKAFEYKLSKDKFYCEADVFRADYVLPSCCQLLNNISSYCI